MPFENFRGLHADRFSNSPGTDACIRSGQENLLLFAVGEVALTSHFHPPSFLSRRESAYVMIASTGVRSDPHEVNRSGFRFIWSTLVPSKG